MGKRFFKLLVSTCAVLRPLYLSLGLSLLTAGVCLIFAVVIIWPAYKNPIARMYTSKLGYSSIIRKTKGAFPVEVTTIEEREIIGKFIGEGLTQSEPIQVPMIAMAKIKRVNAVEGQRIRAGDVIVELDRTKLDLKIQSAESALTTAKAELERVRTGTVNVLQHERPDMQDLHAKAAAAKTEIAQQLLAMYNKLRRENIVTEADLADKRLNAINAEFLEKETKLSAEMAAYGRERSIQIAESAITEADLTLKHRICELDDYTSISPADGIVERVLVHAGEYNQDPGRPAVLIASGLWFECYLDQTALGRVKVGDEVEVRLAAHQDQIIKGAITQVRPLVNFALGGPETNRPIRPLGTGSPEWPSTFSVRIEMETNDLMVVPGLTGYATVLQRRKVLALPRGSISAVSGNRGIVYVVGDDEQSFEPRNVTTGISDGLWIEVREGLTAGEVVISDGYQVLQPDDRIVFRKTEADPMTVDDRLKPLRYRDGSEIEERRRSKNESPTTDQAVMNTDPRKVSESVQNVER